MSDEIVDQSLECPVNTTIEIIAGKWKPSILCELRHGARRFNDLKRDIPGISDKVLSAHLRQLEADGIVSRREFHEGAVLASDGIRFHRLRPQLDTCARCAGTMGLAAQAAGR